MGSELEIIINKRSNSSFKFSFSFLPKKQKEAIKIVYDYCRVTDDIVDGEYPNDMKQSYLNEWKQELSNAINDKSKYPLLNKLIEVARWFQIPFNLFYDLISGVEMDLYKNRYDTFIELEEYCRLVASSVGLMVVRIFGNSNQRIDTFATNLGIALQLTNILRDLKVDTSMNRIYFPLEDLKRFNYPEEMLLNCTYNNEFIKLMDFEAKRAESYYEKANSILKPEDQKYLIAPKIMECIYYQTLVKIKRNKYDVFRKRIRLSKFLQFYIAVKYFVRVKLFR